MRFIVVAVRDVQKYNNTLFHTYTNYKQYYNTTGNHIHIYISIACIAVITLSFADMSNYYFLFILRIIFGRRDRNRTAKMTGFYLLNFFRKTSLQNYRRAVVR